MLVTEFTVLVTFLSFTAAALIREPRGRMDTLPLAGSTEHAAMSHSTLDTSDIHSAEKYHAHPELFPRNVSIIPPSYPSWGNSSRSSLKTRADTGSQRSFYALRLTLSPDLLTRYTTVGFGTNAVSNSRPTSADDGEHQYLTAEFSTDTPYTFIPSVGCKENCEDRTMYDPSLSTSSSASVGTFRVIPTDAFGGVVEGELRHERISIGPFESTLSLGLASRYSIGYSKANFVPAGVVAMNYQPALQSATGSNPNSLVWDLATTGQITRAEFTLLPTAFLPKTRTQGASAISQLIFGPTSFGETKMTHVSVARTHENRWKIPLVALFVNRRVVSESEFVIVSSGDHLYRINNPTVVRNIYRSIPNARLRPDLGNRWSIPCTAKFPSIALNIGGSVFALKSQLLVLPFLDAGGRGTGGCYGAITTSTTGITILGAPVVNQLIANFDLARGKVGFGMYE